MPSPTGTTPTWPTTSGRSTPRSEEHTSELQSHSDLHSFPTRRSSDLGRGRALARLRRRHHPAQGPPPRPRLPHRRRKLLLHQGLSGGEDPAPAPPCQVRLGQPRPGRRRAAAQRPDRKSTRLNSSHTVIYTLSLHDALPILDVVERWLDCDADTILLKVHPHGPACHTGAESCFFTRA